MIDEIWTWTGFPGSQLRPLSEGEARRAVWTIVLMYGSAAIVGIPVAAGWVSATGLNSDRVALGVLPAVVGTIAFGWLARSNSSTLNRCLPYASLLGFTAAVLAVSSSIVAAGPRLGVIAVYFVEAPLMAFFMLRLRWAICWTVGMLISFGIALTLVDDVALPGLQWVVVLTSAVLSAALVGGTASRLDGARQQLAALNGRFRRFLAPQVADALTTGEEQLAPHRSTIAVFFVDLRGFTTFTNASDPDRVVGVLAEYYAAVGNVVDKYRGTIGGFDGDGVFAFLGDPVPNENAAADALAMAQEVATTLDALTAAWGVGYGIGMAFGEATAGVVGFEGRLDYTPVGACVNLAARLCADAKHGEIVIDEACKDAARVASAERRAPVDLKGFGEVATYGVAH